MAVGQTSRAELQNEWPNGSGAWAPRSTLKGKRAQGLPIPAPRGKCSRLTNGFSRGEVTASTPIGARIHYPGSPGARTSGTVVHQKRQAFNRHAQRHSFDN